MHVKCGLLEFSENYCVQNGVFSYYTLSQEIVTRENMTEVESLAAEAFVSSNIPCIYVVISTRLICRVLSIRDAMKADFLVAKMEASLLIVPSSVQQRKT